MNKVIAAAMMMSITTAMPAMAGNNNHRHHAYRPVVKTCTFRVSRHAAHHHAVAKAERIHGVMGVYWSSRTHEMTVRYDARVTSARHIMHLVA